MSNLDLTATPLEPEIARLAEAELDTLFNYQWDLHSTSPEYRAASDRWCHLLMVLYPDGDHRTAEYRGQMVLPIWTEGVAQ